MAIGFVDNGWKREEEWANLNNVDLIRKGGRTRAIKNRSEGRTVFSLHQQLQEDQGAVVKVGGEVISDKWIQIIS